MRSVGFFCCFLMFCCGLEAKSDNVAKLHEQSKKVIFSGHYCQDGAVIESLDVSTWMRLAYDQSGDASGVVLCYKRLAEDLDYVFASMQVPEEDLFLCKEALLDLVEDSMKCPTILYFGGDPLRASVGFYEISLESEISLHDSQMQPFIVLYLHDKGISGDSPVYRSR